jgi:Domain of unknown function (DUF4265)
MRFFVHPDPVWRDRADFIIHGVVRASDHSVRGLEQLWARQLGEAEFEICCLPAYVYDLALSDIVSTAPAHGKKYVVSSILRRSGRLVFRVWLGDTDQSDRDRVLSQLVALNTLMERPSPNLVVLDAHNQQHAQAIADQLQAMEDSGLLKYETGF